MVALRVSTNWQQNELGQYDDRIAVLRKAPDGSVKIWPFHGNTEPAGRYAAGHKRESHGSHTDMNGDGKMDLGRLVLGSYRYKKRVGNFMNDVAFRATRTQVAERDTNQDGSFDANDRSLIGRTHVGTSVLIHRGGSAAFTGSAGCQTIKPTEYKQFLAAIAISSQREFSYVLARR